MRAGVGMYKFHAGADDEDNAHARASNLHTTVCVREQGRWWIDGNIRVECNKRRSNLQVDLLRYMLWGCTCAIHDRRIALLLELLLIPDT